MNNVPSLELFKKLIDLGYTKTKTKDPYTRVCRFFAPTVMDMIDTLPQNIGNNNLKIERIKKQFEVSYVYGRIELGPDCDQCGYGDEYMENILYRCDGKSLPNLLAETIIRCIENKYLSFNDTND